MSYPNQLAWHETLDLHELVAFQANGLIKLKNQLEMYRIKHFNRYILKL